MAIQNAKPERIEAVEVDINDVSLADGIETELDLKEDFQARACPPPGRSEVNKPKLYKMKVFCEDTSFEQNTKFNFAANDPNGKYYTKQLICKLQDPTGTWQDSICYYKISTAVPKGKKISSAAGLLLLMGIKVPAKITDKALAQLVYKGVTLLDSKDKNYVVGDCDWSAWDKTKTSKRAEFGSQAILSNGKVATSMANFPRKADGTFEHIAYTKDGLEVIAGLKVLKIHALAKPVATPAQEPAKAIVAQPKPQAKPPVKEEPVEDLDATSLVLGDDGEVVLED